MKPAVHHALFVLMLLSLTLFASAALADPATPVTAASLAVYWPQLVIFGCIGATYLLRRFAPQGHFFHTDFGAWVLTSSTFVLSIVATTVQAKGLSGIAVLQALMGAGMAALGLSNPSVPAGTTPPMAMKRKDSGVARTELTLLLACLALAGCAGWQAWKTCELGKLPQVAEPVIANVSSIATTGGANWQSQLEGLATSLAPGQLNCAITAIIAAWESEPTQTQSTTLLADQVSVHKAAIGRLKSYLSSHSPSPALSRR